MKTQGVVVPVAARDRAQALGPREVLARLDLEQRRRRLGLDEVEEYRQNTERGQAPVEAPVGEHAVGEAQGVPVEEARRDELLHAARCLPPLAHPHVLAELAREQGCRVQRGELRTDHRELDVDVSAQRPVLDVLSSCDSTAAKRASAEPSAS